MQDSFILDIGRRIRNLRSAADLTQDELAGRADLTDGFISQVERGRTSLSIDSLKQILDALNISLAEFFRDVEPVRVTFTSRDQAEIEDGEGNLALLVPGATNRRMEPALLHLPPGASSALRSPYQGDAFGYLVQGRAVLLYGTDQFKVRAGDCFYVTADREHRIGNPYRAKATLLWVTSPPNF
ncbi:MAG: helix-turn-helix domain-containing protein [Calditrichaeota bacterium]|nr:helix-turn-helix domain-containing protein [Calditrichota bacterium]